MLIRVSFGVGSVSIVYDFGIPNAIVCDSPSTEAITGEVMAIDSETPFFSITGEVIAILSFLYSHQKYILQ